MIELVIEYTKNNPLGLLILLVTIVLLYFYFIDKDWRLSKGIEIQFMKHSLKYI